MNCLSAHQIEVRHCPAPPARPVCDDLSNRKLRARSLWCRNTHAGIEAYSEANPVRCTCNEDALADRSKIKQEMIALLPRLRRFARTLTRSVQEADDLVQEACLRALSRVDQWDPAQPLDRWLFRITRNLWVSELRKRSVRTGTGHIPAEEASELVTAETGESGMIAAELGSLVTSLPQELTSVLLAVAVEGYSYAEAATLFDIPVGTVMSRMHRARKTLSERIAEREAEAQ